MFLSLEADSPISGRRCHKPARQVIDTVDVTSLAGICIIGLRLDAIMRRPLVKRMVAVIGLAVPIVAVAPDLNCRGVSFYAVCSVAVALRI